MTYDQALTWLLQVGGRLYYANPNERKPNSWVAVVRVPAPQTFSSLVLPVPVLAHPSILGALPALPTLTLPAMLRLPGG